MCAILEWNTNVHSAIVEAITGFELRKLGWMGFENLTWVKEVKTRYPAIENITTNTSAILGVRLAEVTQLFAEATTEDRPVIRSYFVAKLALEKLSCDFSGAGAGMCDKYSAYMQISRPHSFSDLAGLFKSMGGIYSRLHAFSTCLL